MQNTQQAVGIFGGSFDPIHFGHLRAALELAFTFDLADVRLIPNGQPPHRDAALANAEQRGEMLELALRNAVPLSLDRCELDRSGPSYSIDTLQSLRAELAADTPLIMGVGADAFQQLASWRRGRELIEYAHIAVLTRPGSPLASDADVELPFAADWVTDPTRLIEQPCGLVYKLEMTPLAISSTRIRQQIAAGWSPRYLVPESVCNYIEQHNLYATDMAHSRNT
ncbi:MAG: nicotinate-nucleotide adenylyltransferase [Pseudomonadales bacterium]